MTAALRAGIIYFIIIFVIGIMLGTVRVLFVLPHLGETRAVLLELPVMLAFSWIACAWVARRFTVSPRVSERLTMGGSAFVLLMLGEVAISVLGLGRSLAEHFASYNAISAQLGLAAQGAFALFPLLQASPRRPH